MLPGQYAHTLGGSLGSRATLMLMLGLWELFLGDVRAAELLRS